MRITFILPFIRLTGGIKANFYLAYELHQRGHTVNLVYPTFPLTFGRKLTRVNDFKYLARKFKKTLFTGKRVGWFKRVEPFLVQVPSLHEMFIPAGDAIIATAWPTTYYVTNYGRSKGRKLYLIRDYEIWSGPKQLVDASYNLDLHMITTSTTLENILWSKFKKRIIGKVSDGVDLNDLYREKRSKVSENRILMQYNPIPRKGFEDGVTAFERVKAECPEIELALFGYHEPSQITKKYEYHQHIVGKDLRDLYNSCDIFLFSSREEGWGMPPMEAMACGSAVVATNTGGVPDFAIQGKTCLVSQPYTPDKLAENLLKVVRDKKLRKQIAKNGEMHIRNNFTWRHSAIKFERILEKLLLD